MEAGAALDAFGIAGAPESGGTSLLTEIPGNIDLGAGAAIEASEAAPAVVENAGIAVKEAEVQAANDYGALSNAEQYGIRRYGSLKYATRGTGLEAHHLIPQRFAELFDQNVRDMLSVAVTRAEHEGFT